MMQKQLGFFSYLVLMLLMLSTLPSSAQVVHVNPSELQASSSMPIEQEMNYILNYMQGSMEAISVNLKANNFIMAGKYFAYYNASCDAYLERLSRMNLTESDYELIASNINISRSELYNFIQDSEAYNQSFIGYTNATAVGNTTGAIANAQQAGASYDRLATAYDYFRRNATVIEVALNNNDMDATPFENALDNINDYMGDLSYGYNQPGINNNSTNLQLAIDPDIASIGDNVTLTITFTDAKGMPISDAAVNIFNNNQLIGRVITNGSGFGTYNYVIPANISGDQVQVHAEALPTGGIRAFSNKIGLSIPDKNSMLTLTADNYSATYGQSIRLSGLLTATDGTPAPGKSINVYVNNEFSGTATTDNNGSYIYWLNVLPESKAGKYGMYTAYYRKPGSVFLNSTSQQFVLTVDQKYTDLNITNYTAFYPGDLAHVRGTIATDDGLPVYGANLGAYIDGVECGNGTSNKGAFDIVLSIPDNMPIGSHELYAVFEPGAGKALRNSTSEHIGVTFNEKSENLTVDSIPSILFRNGTLYVNGTLATSGGIPLAGRTLDINVSGVGLGRVKTDDAGRFNSSYIIDGTEPIGFAQISVYVPGTQNNEILYTGQVFIVPYDMFPALGAPILILVVIIAVIYIFVIRARPEVRSPERLLMPEALKSPEKVPEQPAVVLPAWTLAEAENPKSGTKPVPFSTVPAKVVQAKPKFEARPLPKLIPKPKTEFSIDNEIDSIKSTISSGNIKEAMTHIYVASRKIVSDQGVETPDSMTHTEFYHNTNSKHPIISQPLSQIISAYEKASFTRREVNSAELNNALNGLKEIYESMKNEGRTK